MKKFLLSLAISMTAVCGAFAQTTVTAEQIDVNNAVTIDGYTIAVQKNSGGTAPAINTNNKTGDKSLRLYAKNSLTISGEKISKIVVTLAADAAQRYAEFTPSVGAWNPAQAEGDTEINWEGDAATVTFTVGEKSIWGTDGATKAAQLRIASLTIYGEGGGNVDPTPDPDPDPITTEGDGSENNPYTVADVIALKSTKPAAAWVKGYIVGDLASSPYYHAELVAPFTANTNLYIAATTTETDTTKMVPVQLPAGNIRTALNLVENAGNLGKELRIKGELIDYFKLPGLKNPTEYKLYGQGVDPTPDPDPVTTEGEGTEEKPYTVADVIALNNTKADAAWVKGYIVGDLASSPYYHAELAAPFTTDTNLYIAATTTETDTTKMVPVQLPVGDLRSALNLKANEGNLGKELLIKGELVAYFKLPGIKNPTDYKLDGQGLEPTPVAETPSLTSFVEEQSEDYLKITGAVTVFYQSPDKKYAFITDGETNLEIYGALPEYKNGDQLTGIVGKYGFYQNMPQMTPQVDSFGEATAGTPVEPKNVAFNQVGICDYVVIDAIEITEADGKFYIGQGDEQRQVFDRFALKEIKAGVATITGIGAIFGETKQIFPISIDYKSSISEISAEAAAGQVYDLQGRKVANPVRGLYIVGGQKKFIR